jgi:hypothetical protein
MLIHWIVV